MHADQVENLLGQPCEAIVISPLTPAPQGFCVTTLFHLDDIERVWPGRASSFNFVHIDITPHIRAAIAAAQNHSRIVICEFDAPLATKDNAPNC